MSDPLDAVKPESPWEDTLILAFRDIQWVLHNEERESLILESCTGLIPEKNHSPDPCDPAILLSLYKAALESIAKDVKRKPITPPLLAKLDGKAESAAGDVVTASGKRFFLMEFKAHIGDKSTEHTKFIGVLMRLLDCVKHKRLIEISERGHYFVSADTQDSDILKPLTLEARIYYQVVTQPASNRPPAIEIRTLLRDSSYGLTLQEMADYLSLLCRVHTDGAGGGKHPMKVAIASDTGECWPVCDLGELHKLSAFFDAQPSMPQRSNPSIPAGMAIVLTKKFQNYVALDSDEEREKHLEVQFKRNKNTGPQSFTPSQ